MAHVDGTDGPRYPTPGVVLSPLGIDMHLRGRSEMQQSNGPLLLTAGALAFIIAAVSSAIVVMLVLD
jgi:hypothetical protein